MAKMIIKIEETRPNGLVAVDQFSAECELSNTNNQLIGLIFQSPNGTKWRLKVSDSGLPTVEVVA